MNKTIPYKDTFLTFYNYKEPLKNASTGYGYQGVLLGSVDGEKVQCHLCGDLHRDLGPHIRAKHADVIKDTREYKQMFGLAVETALVSEKERERRKIRTMKWWMSLTKAQRDALNQKRSIAWNEYRKKHPYPKGGNWKIQLETKNKRGTCPDQLLDKITRCAEDLGKTPTKAEFIEWDKGSQRYVHLIYTTFGSFKDAVRLAGLREHVPVQNGGMRRYSDEELLDMLSIFHQENGRIPSYTDSRRKLIPAYEIYIRRFGSFSRARKLAGITERPTRWGKNVPA